MSEYEQMLDNLTATQARCTELIGEAFYWKSKAKQLTVAADADIIEMKRLRQFAVDHKMNGEKASESLFYAQKKIAQLEAIISGGDSETHQLREQYAEMLASTLPRELALNVMRGERDIALKLAVEQDGVVTNLRRQLNAIRDITEETTT